MKKLTLVALSLLTAALYFFACGDSEKDDANGDENEGKTGTVVFTANGEDFVREGFVSEDNWRIDFEHVYINIRGITAYQVAVGEEKGLMVKKAKLDLYPRHAGHPHAEIPEGSAHVALTETFFVDLRQGGDTIELGSVEDAPIGNYNYINFNVAKATAESKNIIDKYKGYSVVMVGEAKNNDTGEKVSFEIMLTEEMNYVSCGPNPENIGVVKSGGTGYAEATFHFDHIFGDFEEGPADTTDEEAINFIAIGFAPFASLAKDGVLIAAQDDLKALKEYDQFRDALRTLGHFGEAHCGLK